MDGSTTLGELDEEQRYAVFDDLQQHLPHVWDAMRRDRPEESAVVVPSISLERTTASSGTLMQAMEERALFQLLLLRQPMLTLVYVTSSPIADEIIEYYLGLLPGVVPSQARRRLRLVSVGDASPRPLSEKVLARPRVLRQIRELIPDQSVSHLIPYTTTELERDVAISLGIPMYGADPRLAPLGSKSGCRRLFEEVGVRAPAGAEGLRTVDDLVASVTKMRAPGPSPAEVIVKINEGVSGSGNALVDLGGLPAPGDPGEASAVRSRLLELQPEADGLEVDALPRGLRAPRWCGGGADHRHRADQPERPDASPARPHRRAALDPRPAARRRERAEVPRLRLPRRPGVLPPDLRARDGRREGARRPRCPGAVRRRLRRGPGRPTDDWTAYAIELNLRKGGTTHPFLTLQYLVGGAYDGDAGLYRAASGAPKYLVATDHLEDDRLTALTTRDVFDVMARKRLHFDHSHETGVVFHMLSCVTECGRLGMTAIGDSPEEAWDTYQSATEALLEEAGMACTPGTLPT